MYVYIPLIQKQLFFLPFEDCLLSLLLAYRPICLSVWEKFIKALDLGYSWPILSMKCHCTSCQTIFQYFCIRFPWLEKKLWATYSSVLFHLLMMLSLHISLPIPQLVCFLCLLLSFIDHFLIDMAIIKVFLKILKFCAPLY